MYRPISFLIAGLLLAQPVIAAPQMNPAKMQQISEVVFKNYPPRALLNGEQGAVYFVVTLDRDAHPLTCQVTHGSGHPLLDEETCNLIVQHAVFNSVKDANGRAIKSTHEGVVNWRIPGAPAAPVTPVALTARTAPEEQVCKKSVRNGTLAGIERTCMTRSEWARQTDETRKTWGDIQAKGHSFCTPDIAVAGGIQNDPILGGAAGC